MYAGAAVAPRMADVHVLLLRSGIHREIGDLVLLVRPVLFPEFPSQLTVQPVVSDLIL